MLRIDAKGSSGGLLRALIPLALSRGVGFRLDSFRSDAAPSGMAWSQVALLEAVARAGLAEIAFEGIGSRWLEVVPTNKPLTSPIRVDLDDAHRVDPVPALDVRRDYDGGEDRFAQNVNNRSGRGVAGQPMSSALLSLLPLADVYPPSFMLDIRGGSETPGAPFIDAVVGSIGPRVRREFGFEVDIDVWSRGPIGRGGGHVTASAVKRSVVYDGAAPESVAVTSYVSPHGEFVDLTPIFEEIRSHGVPVSHRVITIPSPSPYAAYLFEILGENPRDISICHSERVLVST